MAATVDFGHNPILIVKMKYELKTVMRVLVKEEKKVKK